MKRSIALALLLSAGLVATTQAADPSADRQAIMKNVGAATGVGGKMMKGEMDFNPVFVDSKKALVADSRIIIQS